MEPSPSLSNRLKASLNSEIWSSVSWSAIFWERFVIDREKIQRWCNSIKVLRGGAPSVVNYKADEKLYESPLGPKPILFRIGFSNFLFFFPQTFYNISRVKYLFKKFKFKLYKIDIIILGYKLPTCLTKNSFMFLRYRFQRRENT